MQKMLRILAVVSVLLVAALPAYAGDTNAIKTPFLVANMQDVIKSSVALKSIETQLSAKRKALQTELSKEEQVLRAEDETLKKQKGTMPEVEFKEKVTVFKKKILEAQKKVQEGRTKHDRAYSDALRVLRNEVTKIVGDIAKERGAAMVLSNDAVVLAEKELNITAEAVKRLNNKVKTLPLNW